MNKPAKFEKLAIRDSKININSFAEFKKTESENEFAYILKCYNAEIAAITLNGHLNYNYEVYFPLKIIKLHAIKLQ